MGDWIDRWHWVACKHEQAALQVYDRLEHAAIDYRKHGDASLRFGFASPTLIVAQAVRKWGEDTTLHERIGRSLPVSALVRVRRDGLIGDLDALEPEHAFAWTADREVDAALERAGLPAVSVGAVTVRKIERDLVFVRGDRSEDTEPAGSIWRLETPPVLEHGEATIEVGLVSRTHGLVQLGHVGHFEGFTAEAMPLWASRIAGAGNWNVVRDDVDELPSTQLFDDVAWRFERHGPHVLWQSRGQRARWVREAKAKHSATDRLAGSMMARRWGLVKSPRPPRETECWWHAGPDTLAADRLPDAPEVARMVAALDGAPSPAGATRLGAQLAEVIARRDPRVPELASRFAELAHAVSRTSYWMVRDGAPRADLPDDRPGPRPPWDGDPKSVASAIEFWAWCALRASRHGDPARAAAASLIALEAALDSTTPVWWIPPTGWIEALLHAEIAGDSDADIDPTLDEVIGASSLRVRLDRLHELLETDRDRFTADGSALLGDLPSPVSIVHYSTAGELAERALRWTANALAWHAYERGEHDRALELVDRALVVCDQRFDQVRDTKVRALLALGRTDEAYRIVREVLQRDPEFDTFADIAASAGYRSWLATVA